MSFGDLVNAKDFKVEYQILRINFTTAQNWEKQNLIGQKTITFNE